MNIILDYWFIYELHLDSEGAGWATALSQYAMLVVGVGMVLRLRDDSVWRSAMGGLWDKRAWRRLFGLNGDMLIRTVSLQTAFAVFTNVSALFGTGILVANAVLLKVLSVASFFIDGYAYATESLAGAYLGAQDKKSLRKLLGMTIQASVVTGFLLVTLFVGLPGTMFGLMTDHQTVLDVVYAYMHWLYPVVLIVRVAYALDGYFIGLTLSSAMRRSMLVSVAFFVVCSGAAIYLNSNHVLWAAWAGFMLSARRLWGETGPTWS